eukprot:TRINITY_DN24820_c1_g2_i1.p1 TRINITY_DN24820_c1_g2~~TRINITY_DN24820_c1_g2_i1.p1  ORF type:complete len:526 (-),score=49.81 TRINITY_DN24820_c1_g2_i1:308-1885(-)
MNHWRSSASKCSGRARCSRKLCLEVEQDLLRGVGIDAVLTRFGYAFKFGVNDARAEEYDAGKTRKVDGYDDFISHDWVSGRMRKTLALCVIHNSDAAMVVAAIVGACLCALQRLGPVYSYLHSNGEGVYSKLLCPLVFVAVLFCWQDLRAACRIKPRDVFLDKYCIDQQDPERKAKGILGLGGFLKVTKRLVICWTPRYFSRLWCVYEIATWLYLEKGLDHVLIMPLSTSSSLFVSMVVNQVCQVSFHFVSAESSAAVLVAVVIIALFAPFGGHTFRHLEHSIRQLPQQLSDFSVTKAACFCCTQEHKMPGGGPPLKCDRELIYKTLQQWFPVEDDGANTWQRKLAVFDEEIRSLFGAFIVQHAGMQAIHYRHALLVAQPFAWSFLDAAVSYGTDRKDAVISFRSALEYLTLVLCIVPSDMRLFMLIASVCNDLVGMPTNRYKDMLASIACGFLILVLVFCSWLSIFWFSISRNMLGLCLSSSMWFFIVTPLCYRDSLPCTLRQASSPILEKSQVPQLEFKFESE